MLEPDDLSPPEMREALGMIGRIGMPAPDWTNLGGAAIVRACTLTAKYQGLSPLDEYTLMSWYLLKALGQMTKQCLDLHNTMPAPRIVTTMRAALEASETAAGRPPAPPLQREP